MKRIVALLLVVIIIFVLTACAETEAQKLKRYEREAAESEKAAQEAREKYIDTQQKIAQYNSLMDQINNAKP